MSVAELFRIGIIIIGCIINCIILITCIKSSIKIKKSNEEEINSEIIIILITINFVLFVIYGLTRNIK
ncbi:MAG: hypothetical protein J6B87_04220 [Clostridia bacterium]|nr:hypothetical protein [Clostridia bacterium]